MKAQDRQTNRQTDRRTDTAMVSGHVTSLRWICGSSVYSHGASRLSSLKPSVINRSNRTLIRSVILSLTIVTMY